MGNQPSLQEWELLLETPLFAGLNREELADLLGCVGAHRTQYGPGEVVLWQGELVTEVGVLLCGGAQSVKLDGDGRRQIITLLEPGSPIGVLLAASRARRSPVCVEAMSAAAVLFLPFAQMLALCGAQEEMHRRFLRNLFDCIAEKSMVLHDRIECLVRSSVREKVLCYLAQFGGPGEQFRVPLDRAGMAEYLNVERSALSRELSRMKEDGLIDFRRNLFCLR